jgi:predicted TIM-barrel fold metal-dependent hydrolase
VWASDWPFVGYEEAITYRQCVDWLVAWIPDEAVRRTVLVDTPSSLFGFAPAQHRN